LRQKFSLAPSRFQPDPRKLRGGPQIREKRIGIDRRVGAIAFLDGSFDHGERGAGLARVGQMRRGKVIDLPRVFAGAAEFLPSAGVFRGRRREILPQRRRDAEENGGKEGALWFAGFGAFPRLARRESRER
jgi:hypothetical protein